MVLLLFTLLTAHASEKVAGDLFDLDGKNKLFSLETERITTGENMVYTAIFKTLDGQVAAQEKGETKNNTLVRYEASRPPLDEKGLVEVKDGKIIFSYTEKGKTKTSRDNLKPNTLFSGTLVPFLVANLNELLAKKDVSFSYVVWYRAETVGFKFMLDKEENGQIVVKMVPTSLLYRSLVNPLYFTIDKTSHKLLEIKGRTMPKLQIDGKWKDVDALSKYK